MIALLRRAALAGAPRTLAVLPFANLSASAEDGFFADGLTEELLNLLAGIEGLRVTGRTSSFYFKGRNEDLRDIGRKLGVSHILEGSVRRSGERLRVTAQLVSAEDGFHLWSQTYDRELTDVFAIQDEIGRSVADALKIRLATDGPEAPPPRPTVNAEAYRLYLVARSKVRERGLENTQSAVRLFDEAATIDPAFAGAHAGKALALTLLYGNHGVGDGRTMLAEAETAARRALELDPKIERSLRRARPRCGAVLARDWQGSKQRGRRALPAGTRARPAEHAGALLARPVRAGGQSRTGDRALRPGGRAGPARVHGGQLARAEPAEDRPQRRGARGVRTAARDLP